jgi:hypothetical protein
MTPENGCHFVYFFDVLHEAERYELLFIMKRDSEPGQEVLSINIHKMNILLSNLTVKDIEEEAQFLKSIRLKSDAF